jgi:hypothetical protein
VTARFEASVSLGHVDPGLLADLAGTPAEWAHHQAAVSEGFCPACSGRLAPVESTARTAGHCAAHGYFWVGGPDVEFAREGWTSDPSGVPS